MVEHIGREGMGGRLKDGWCGESQVAHLNLIDIRQDPNGDATLT
jgi:hypothetical protein